MSEKRKLNRREFLRLSAAASVGSVLAACAPVTPAAVQKEEAPVVEATAPPEAPTKFMFSTWGDYRFFEDGFKRMQQDYPQYENVTFENSQAESNPALLQRLLTDYAARSWETMPDVCEMSTWAVPQLADAGILVDVTERLAPFEKDISAALLDILRRNGKYFGVPWMPNTSMVWYRQDVFEMAGVNADDIKTWNDFIEAGKVITEFDYPDGVKRYMIHVPATEWDDMPLQLRLGQQGAGLFDRETGDCIIDTDPKFKKAFEVCVREATEGIGITMDAWQTPWYSALEEGIIATYVSADWMDQIFQLSLPNTEGKFRAMKMPAIEPGGARGTFQGGPSNVVAIKKPDLDMELVWAFMEHSFLNSEVTGPLTADWKLVPAYLPAFEHPYYSEPLDFYGGQIIGALDKEIQAEAKPFYFTKDYNETMNLIGTEMQKVWTGEKDVDQAIADAAETIRKDIGTSL